VGEPQPRHAAGDEPLVGQADLPHDVPVAVEGVVDGWLGARARLRPRGRVVPAGPDQQSRDDRDRQDEDGPPQARRPVPTGPAAAPGS
jgi:hypothetical protein